MYDDPQPLHEKADTAKSWLEDELTWADVYSKKPEDYLEAIARGETPRWDSDAGKYVYGDSSVGTTSVGGSAASVQDPQSMDAPDEDLPF
jgi:hypothetical protein